MEHYDILIVGAGAAGIAAAGEAFRAGCGSILLVDRNREPGGVLLQCLHRGFGRDMTGPEYTRMLLENFPKEITRSMDTTVVSLSPDRTAVLKSPTFGEKRVSFRRLILATGCVEIPMGALPIAGSRPRGIYTAGQMQEMINLHGFRPEGPVVILGSGDLGLILARTLYDRNIPVRAIVEKKDHCGGMARNRRFLPDSGIRLLCGCTITEVLGHPRLEGVVLSTGEQIPCATLLIAAGLRPDRTLVHGLGAPDWLHLCGNCSKVEPMVESVVMSGSQAGITAADNS